MGRSQVMYECTPLSSSTGSVARGGVARRGHRASFDVRAAVVVGGHVRSFDGCQESANHSTRLGISSKRAGNSLTGMARSKCAIAVDKIGD